MSDTTTKKERPDKHCPTLSEYQVTWVVCPVCDQTGFTKHATETTCAVMCQQCWGWGWVRPSEAECIHDFKEVEQSEPWRCWHTLECQKCGKKRSYSSDD